MSLVFMFMLVVSGAAKGGAGHAAPPKPPVPAATNAASTPGAAGDQQNAMDDYTSFSIEKAGILEGNLKARTIEHMGNGVKIVLMSKDPEKKPMPITANDMKFTWTTEGEEQKPARILMDGKVVIEQADGVIHADKADFDYEKGVVTFTGDPVMKSEQYPDGVRGQKIILNMRDNEFKVFDGSSKEMPLKGVAGAETASAAPSVQLREADILDWPGFLNKIRAQAAAPETSPGKRIIGQLDLKVQKMIASVPVETLLTQKPAMLKQINRVLNNPKLFDKAAWRGIQLKDETQSLLAQSSLPAKDVARLNRSLVEAAFPGMIAPESKK